MAEELDIANPGADEAALRAALNAVTAPQPVSYTGTWGFKYKPPAVLIPHFGVQVNDHNVIADGPCILDFTYEGGSTITSIEFADLVGVQTDFNLATLAALTDLDLPALRVVGRDISLLQLAVFDSVDLTSLEAVGQDILLDGTTLASLDLSALVAVGRDFTIDGGAALQVLDISALEHIGRALELVALDVAALDVSAIRQIGGSFILDTLPLTSLSFTSIEAFCGEVTLVTGLDTITSITLGAGLLFIGGDINITGPTLPQANVDAILVKLAALDGTGGTTSYDNHNVDLSGNCAVPSAAGLTAKTTLEGRGNTVTVNV